MKLSRDFLSAEESSCPPPCPGKILLRGDEIGPSGSNRTILAGYLFTAVIAKQLLTLVRDSLAMLITVAERSFIHCQRLRTVRCLLTTFNGYWHW